jgi:6-phosphogluconolactonase (cycloisomerase 2 family)
VFLEAGGTTLSHANSDTLTTFRPIIDTSHPSNFNLQLVQWHAAGGSNPRHFAINKAGDLLAVALQDDNKLVVINRDPATGMLGDIIAEEKVPSQPNMIVWDE